MASTQGVEGVARTQARWPARDALVRHLHGGSPQHTHVPTHPAVQFKGREYRIMLLDRLGDSLASYIKTLPQHKARRHRHMLVWTR